MAERDHPPWLLYGANGYTGRMIAAEAVRRGMRPVLAGRSHEPVERLAGELNCPWRAFALDDVAVLAGQLHEMHSVVNAAGPFASTAVPMIEGCLRARVNYLDITGEIDVIEAAAARDGQAREAGVAVLPAVGFDVVPSDCLAAMLAAKLPTARHLILAFTATGGPSPGTTNTAVENMGRGGRVRIEGRIERVPTAWKARMVPFRDHPRHVMLIPWGDVASAYYSTGIPHIETYFTASRAQVLGIRLTRWLLPLTRSASVQRFLKRQVQHRVRGPTPAQLAASRASFWGQVADDAGHTVEATLETPGGYPLTVTTTLACLERVLAGQVVPGFATPSKAFGAEFILGFKGVEVGWPDATRR